MSSPEKLRVALCQRILPSFRVPVWSRLAEEPDLDLMVFHGRGRGKGAVSGFDGSAPFRTHILPTLRISAGRKYRVIHPGLCFHVLSGDFDVVISEGLTYFPCSLLLALICRIQGIPFILYEAPPVGSPSVFRRLFSPLYRRLASRVLTYNSGGLEYFTAHNFPPERVTVALNTVDTELVKERLAAFTPDRQELAAELELRDSFVVGYLGAVEERKRPDLLLTSVLELVRSGLDVKALFVGDGPFMDELRGMVPPELSSRFVFVGRRVEDAEKYIQLFSVLVLPSQGGLAVPHGLTCGIPCLATEEAEGEGIRDYIEDGKNGFILKPGMEGLTSVLRKLVLDPGEVARLSQGAQGSGDSFSVDNMVSAICGAVKAVMEPDR